MKRIVAIAAVVLSGHTILAQTFAGITAGIGQNKLQTNISNRPYQVLKTGLGFATGVHLAHKWRLGKASAIGIETGGNFVQKSYWLSRTDGLHSIDQHTRNGYVQIPVNVSLSHTFTNTSVFISCGAYGAYWLSSRIKGAIPNFFNSAAPYPNPYKYNEKYTFSDVKDNRQEFGWTVGFGAVLDKGKRLYPNFRLDYYQGMTDQQKKYMQQQVPRYNATYVLSAGVSVRLHNPKKDETAE